MKKKIDIEKALQWALIEEMPKGRAVSTDVGYVVSTRLRKRSLMSVAAQFAPSERRDSDALGFVPGAPHEDAERIADAVAGYATSARFTEHHEVVALFGDLAGIAEDAIASIMTATVNPQALVISHAISGKRPRWQFGNPRPYQMRVQFRDAVGSLRDRPRVVGVDADGDIVELSPNRGRAAMKFGMYDFSAQPRSPLQWDNPSLIHIGHARAEYLAWYGALATLADGLRDALVEFEVMPPVAARLPWVTGQTPASRVLSDGFPKGLLTIPLVLQPKRSAPDRPFESEIEKRHRQSRAKSRLGSHRKTATAQTA